MAGAKKADRVFNTLKPKLLRKRIPRSEVVFGGVFLAGLALLVGCVGARGDDFDPAERDVSIETLEKDSVEDTLYRTPFKTWREPGAVPADALAGSGGPGVPGGAGGAAGSAADLGIFPAAALAGGWNLDGRVETFDASNLYEKINGAAEQYLAFGFRKLHYVNLAQGGQSLAVELYDMGEFRNVLGLFFAQRDPDRPVERLGRAFFYPTGAGAVGGVENLYFRMSGSVSGPPVTTKALELVKALAAMPLPVGPRPAAYTILAERLNLPIERIAYEKENVFQYDFVSDFWFGTDGKGAARYFVHEAPDAGAAQALCDRIEAEQANEHAVVERDGGRVLMQHEYLKTFFVIGRRDRLIYGVERAEDRAAAMAGLERLERALGRG